MKKLISLLIVTLLIGTCVCSPNVFCVETTNEQGIYHIKYLDDMNYVWVDDDGNEVNMDEPVVEELPRDGINNLPNTYDSRVDAGIKQSVSNQGITGACGAFSAITVIETDATKRKLCNDSTLDLSEAHLMWFTNTPATDNSNDSTYGDGYNKTKPYSQGIGWRKITATLARGSGAVYERSFPYFPYEPDKMGNYDEDARYLTDIVLTDSEHLPDKDIDAMKTSIMDHGAIQICYKSKSELYTTSPNGVCFYNPNSDPISHAVAVIGWDDGFSKANFGPTPPEDDGAWLCKNSWSTEWGNSGYFWLSYYDASIEYCIAYSTENVNYDNIYQYDGIGYHSAVSNYNGHHIETANVYISEKNEFLTDISFYTVNKNIAYIVRIYKNVEDSGPETGTLMCTIRGAEKYAGYHTCKLDNAYFLSSGTKFSVVVELYNTASTSANTVSAPIEGRNYPETNTFFGSNPGESWLNRGYGWGDMTKSNYNNACIKAFATSKGTECIHEYAYTGTVKAGCDEGYDTETCSLCGRTRKINFTIATHNWETAYIVNEPTCTAKGLEMLTCIDCGETKTQKIDKIKHSYVVTNSIPATCESCAQIIYQCSSCLIQYTDSSSTPLGHVDLNNDNKCDRCSKMLANTISCNCICHKSGLNQFVFKLSSFFWKLFEINKTCSCGKRHY